MTATTTQRRTKTRSTTFKVRQHVIYPGLGLGQITGIESQTIDGVRIEFFVVNFTHSEVTVRVPIHKATKNGMRKLSSAAVVSKAFQKLAMKPKPRGKDTWSRRSTAHEDKIKTGDLVLIAEVIRDVHAPTERASEMSWSETQILEAAMDRFTQEVAVVEGVDPHTIKQRVTDLLWKTPA